MISRYSVKKPMTIFVVMVLIVLLGYTSFTNMTTDLLPNMELPYVVVYTTYPGANPEKVELSVTKPLEQSLATTSGIDTVNSISRENLSIIILEFTYGTNMDSAMIEMSGKIDMVKGFFDDTVSSPTLMKINPDMMPVLIASADLQDQDIYTISAYVSDVVVPRLERVDGVASVSATGLLEEQIRIDIDAQKVSLLNEKILDSVDEEMADAWRALREAAQGIQAGQAALQAQIDDQLPGMVEAQVAMSEALSQIQSGIAGLEDGLDSLNDQLSDLLEQRTALEAVVAAYVGLPGIQSQIAGCQAQIVSLNGQIAAQQAVIDDLQTQIDTLEAISGRTPAQEQELQDLYAQMEVENAAMTALQSQLASAQAQLAALEAQETQMQQIIDGSGFANQAEAEAALLTLNGSIAALQAQIAVMEQQLNSLNAQKNELIGQIKDLESGKLTFEQAMVLLSVQLANAEETLSQSREQLSEAEEAARENAGIDSLITQSMISGILTAENFAMPAGTVTQNGEDYAVKVGDVFYSVSEIENLVLMDTGIDGVGEVRIRDVANVSLSDNAADIYAKINGNNGVLFTVQKQSTASTADVSKRLNAAMDELMADNPDLHLIALQDQGVYIDMVISSVLRNLLFGGILAVLVLFLFLRSIRSTLIIALSIPLSVMASLVCMYFTGVTLNIISLAGLALGVGMLVDNSIVAIENIYRLRSEGMSAARAAARGAVTVSGALFASTLTTVCVFLPIVFTDGLSKQLFSAMGLTIAFSLLSSLAVALTLVPAMSSKLLRRATGDEYPWFNKLVAWYSKVLRHALSHKLIWLGSAVILLAVSIFGVTVMGTQFLPDMDAYQLSASINTEQELSTFDMRAMADEVSTRIQTIDDVDTVGAMESGGGGGVFAMRSSVVGGSNISLYILLKEDKTHTSAQVGELIEQVTADLGVTVDVSSSTMDMSALGGSGIQVLIQGNDLDKLQSIAGDVSALIASVEGIKEVDDGLGDTQVELRIIVDKNEAMGYGLTVVQVYQSVAESITEETAATTVSIESIDLPVIVVGSAGIAVTRSNLSSLTIEGMEDGEKVDVRLRDIATIEEAQSPGSINHENQVRTVTVSAMLENDYNIGLVSQDVEQTLSAYNVPDGYTLSYSGENETIQDSMRDLVYMILLAVAFIYLIMTAQFQSLLSPLIVMFTIPLAFTGGLLALWLTGFELSVISMLGFLVLSGVVVNNGIVFVDYVNQLRLSGMEKREALLLAGKHRIRPILMTAITTILGLSTLSFGMGMGSDMLQPMAVATIGGLLYATLLTLIVVPIMYDLLHRKPMKAVDLGEDELDAGRV